MTSTNRIVFPAYWLVTAAAFAVSLALLAFYAPVEATMGPIQKIFYVHLPSAICTFFACLLCFVASIGYLTQRTTWWDDLAAASARVALGLCTVVLITGMIWGRSAWGQWWTWSPRLTFSLVLWLLYVVYVMIRASIESGSRRSVIAAVYGIIAFLDVPLVYLSVRLMPDIHPTSVRLAPAMKLTLAAWFVPVALLMIGCIAAAYASNVRARAMAVAQEEASSAVDELSPTSFRWAGSAFGGKS